MSDDFTTYDEGGASIVVLNKDMVSPNGKKAVSLVASENAYVEKFKQLAGMNDMEAMVQAGGYLMAMLEKISWADDGTKPALARVQMDIVDELLRLRTTVREDSSNTEEARKRMEELAEKMNTV